MSVDGVLNVAPQQDDGADTTDTAPSPKSAAYRRGCQKKVPLTLDTKSFTQVATQTQPHSDKSISVESDDSSDAVALADHSSVSSCEVVIHGARVKEWYLDCTVEDVPLRAVIDSGTSISTMN